MKICICTVPIRSEPTTYPPFGGMFMVQVLRKLGLETHFYNIDYFRPKQDDIVTYFRDNKFDVVGISAVVSTAYSYTKYLVKLIKDISPDTVVIVGGNLAASAEILLRKCSVDFCVVGDGELIIQDLVDILQKDPKNYEKLKTILGICFLDEKGEFQFTGYRISPSLEDADWPDYSILEADGSISYYIENIPSWYSCWGIEVPVGMQGKKGTVIPVAKGCINRCTFCHRWEKGYRLRPISKIIAHIQYLKEHYNVGFLCMDDEAFGSNRRYTRELVTSLGKMGVIWRAGSVRASAVDKETLRYWKANGCCMVIYGTETGSQTMLDIMEKNTTVEMNINALKWVYEVGLLTSAVQLVIGMPGETDKTIRETIEFLKKCMPYYPSAFRKYLLTLKSINYVQALPGTPIYEYARQNGFIGKSLDAEEEYLIKVSDVDALSSRHFINCTNQPLLKVLSWKWYIGIEVDSYYLKHILGITLSFTQVINHLLQSVLRCFLKIIWPRVERTKTLLEVALGKQFINNFSGVNFRLSPVIALRLNAITRKWIYPLLVFPLSIVIAIKQVERYSKIPVLIFEYIGWSIRHIFNPPSEFPKESLRKRIIVEPLKIAGEGSRAAVPLRLGR